MKKELKQGIISKINKGKTCWIWSGKPRPDGYGKVYIKGKGFYVHRVVYEILVGKIPKGRQLDHLCRNRICVNPKHLEPVTNRENVLRGTGISAQNHRKNSCIHGHPLSGKNVRITKEGHRDCRECGKVDARNFYKKHKK